MKLPKKLMVGAAVCVVAPALLFAAVGVKKRNEVERAYRNLRAEGFEVDRTKVGKPASREMIERGKIALKADLQVNSVMDTDIRWPVYRVLGAFHMHGSNSVVVPWKEEFYAGPKKRSPWPAIHQTLEKRRIDMDAAAASSLAGPIAYPPLQPGKENEHEGYLIDGAARGFALRVLCNLHYGEHRDAWTNLLALTRLVTLREVEPAYHLQRTYLALMPIAEVTTWYAMQDHHWTDQQLATLQDEWSRVDFFSALPNSIAYQRASVREHFDAIRHPKDEDMGIEPRELLRHPQMIPGLVKGTARISWYRWSGSYDERDVLFFFCDREVEMRRVCNASTLREMLTFPSVTNAPVFNSRFGPDYPASFASQLFFLTRPKSRYVGTLGFAVEAEIRRRLILTALEIERYKLRAGRYPETLDELAPSRPALLVDFADGQPLRYRTNSAGNFLLYSVGLDCADNQGAATLGTNRFAPNLHSGLPRNTDILWPFPTSLPKPDHSEPAE